MVKKHTAPFSDTPPHPSAAFESDTSANKTSDMWGGVGTIAPLPHISLSSDVSDHLLLWLSGWTTYS